MRQPLETPLVQHDDPLAVVLDQTLVAQVAHGEAHGLAGRADDCVPADASGALT